MQASVLINILPIIANILGIVALLLILGYSIWGEKQTEEE